MTFRLIVDISLIIYCAFFYKNLVSGFDLENNTNRSWDDGENCSRFLQVFAETTSNFSSCAILNARPINMCVECVESFRILQESFRDILEKSYNLTRCSALYLDLDRLQIIRSLYSYSTDLWDRGSCNSCFKMVDNKVTNETSIETNNFLELYNETMTCITTEQQYNVTGELLCENCMEVYVSLNDFYEHIKVQNKEDTVCMDVVDLMNTTRQLWSTQLDCCRLRRHSELPFLIITSTIFIIPIIFYASLRYLAKTQQPEVIRQQRFTETFNTPTTSTRLS